MILIDVNVLVYAFRTDAPDHRAYTDWLSGVLQGDQAYGTSDVVLSGFLRVVTHPRVFRTPSKIDVALAFCQQVRDRPHSVRIEPGIRHWHIFMDLCRKAAVKGNLVPDAYFAALAIESGSEWITTDRDYARFPGLRRRHPLG